jgi:hypothetical protein
MGKRADKRRWPGPRGQTRCAALLALLMLVAALAGCTQSASAPPSEPEPEAAATVTIPERCQGDGAVQTWLLLPQTPRNGPSELLAAYQARQVIEFQATVIGQDDSPARQPHRRFLLREAAEGLDLWLDYQGDPPPLVQGQSYRFIAWADLMDPGQPATEPGAASATPERNADIPASRGYELQVFDSAGLLFLGRTDVDEQDDALALQLLDAPGDCPAVPARPAQSACVQSRTTLPLTVRWGGDELMLYPGEDGVLAHQGASYRVALFRNRQVVFADPPCADYHEHRRSLRIDRVEPLPVLPAPPAITVTASLTTTLPLTLPAPLPAEP